MDYASRFQNPVDLEMKYLVQVPYLIFYMYAYLQSLSYEYVGQPKYGVVNTPDKMS